MHLGLKLKFDMEALVVNIVLYQHLVALEEKHVFSTNLWD
jgi:hypothetical protein